MALKPKKPEPGCSRTDTIRVTFRLLGFIKVEP